MDEDQSTIWAAIEISGRLCRPLVTESRHGLEDRRRVSTQAHTSPSELGVLQVDSTTDQCLKDLFRHGCLYNLKVEVLPAAGTSLLEVLNDGPFPT